MRISQDLYDRMIVHAREEAPNECCGMVAARQDEAVKVYRTTNIEASPLRFQIDPEEQLRVSNDIDQEGLELAAIYHSHTRTEPRPSQTDISFAKLWPGVLWVIVGLAGSEPQVQTWRIDDGQVAEAELVVE
jgi:[CysO sulfur-carrier protein]-S-L-cysteine hydrolase